jgi:hypothetical protein
MTVHSDVSSASTPSPGATVSASGAMELPPSVREFLARDHKLLIGGEWVDAADGATFETLDPATGQVLATVPAGDRSSPPPSASV